MPMVRLLWRDDDELRVRQESLQKPDEPVDVRFVQRRVQLVQHAERAGLDLVNGEQQRHRRHRLLAARQERNRLQLLARRPRHDVNPALQQIVLVHQQQVRLLITAHWSLITCITPFPSYLNLP